MVWHFSDCGPSIRASVRKGKRREGSTRRPSSREVKKGGLLGLLDAGSLRGSNSCKFRRSSCSAAGEALGDHRQATLLLESPGTSTRVSLVPGQAPIDRTATDIDPWEFTTLRAASTASQSEATEPIRLTREELYGQVWSQPMSKLATSFAVSDRGLAKICERHRIPRPPRGYWRRLETGKRVRRKPLPPLLLAEAALATIIIKPKPVEDSMKRAPSLGDLQAEFEARTENRIEVPERVGRYHPLVQKTQKALERSRRKRGLMDPHDFRPVLDGVAPVLDVQVEGENQRRALYIMDTLIKALERRGFGVQVKQEEWRRKYETFAVFGETEIRIRIRERYLHRKLSPHEQGKWGYPKIRREATGELLLEILYGRGGRHRCVWKDGKRRRIEARLNEFVAELVQAAEAKREWERELEESQRRWATEEEARRERDRLRRLEEARREELRRQAAAWEECHQLRRYIAAVRDAAAQCGGLASDGKLAAWIAWAENYVESADPLNRLEELAYAPEATRAYPSWAGSR